MSMESRSTKSRRRKPPDVFPHLLTRARGGVELPSDYQGVIYVELDTGGAWRAKLAQELVQAKLPIDLTGLLGG